MRESEESGEWLEIPEWSQEGGEEKGKDVDSMIGKKEEKGSIVGLNMDIKWYSTHLFLSTSRINERPYSIFLCLSFKIITASIHSSIPWMGSSPVPWG